MTALNFSDIVAARFAPRPDTPTGPRFLPADDAFSVNEGAALTGNVFSDNGSGVDVDASPTVATVNGDALSVGVQITLTSGALLTLNADGTFTYDQNGAFDELPGAGSGASITSLTDSFTYTLAGGGSATVTITINGQDSDGDQLVGTAGADILNGGIGADIMAGGDGDDRYYVDDYDDLVLELLGGGSDWIYSSVDYQLATGSYVQRLILTGSQNLYAVGNEIQNTLIGNSGSNILDGLGGADIMRGRDGDDAYFVDNVGDVVEELDDEGLDVIYSSVSYTLLDTSFVEALVLDCGADINATGNNQVNYLVGNCGENILDGRGGADAMVGGGGDDIYYVDDPDDWVIEYEGEGTDWVYSTVSYALLAGSYVQGLTLLGTSNLDATGNGIGNTLTGNAGANVLTGGGGRDILNGMGGADTMIGGSANDTYYIDNVSDVIVELRGEGIDVAFSTVSYTLAAGSYVQGLTLLGTGDLNATGNGIGNTLTGNAGANVLTGGGGRDILNGMGGADTMIGGSARDTFVFTSTTHSTVLMADRIVDLKNSDFIDLSAIDADVNAGGHQAFTLVDDFTNTAGQVTLTWDAGAGLTRLNADTNGDGVSDMLVLIDGDHEDFTNFIFGG